MFVIDTGERKLVKIRLLDELGNPIPWSHFYDVRMSLMIGGGDAYTYSKDNGDLISNGEYAQFEITQQQSQSTLPPTSYQLKISADVLDLRFTKPMTDTQWISNFMRIRPTVSVDSYDPSVYTQDVKLAVQTTDVPDSEAPFQSPGVSWNSTETTATYFLSNVFNANGFEWHTNLNEPESWTKLDGNTLIASKENDQSFVRRYFRAYNNAGAGPPTGPILAYWTPTGKPVLNYVNPQLNSIELGVENYDNDYNLEWENETLNPGVWNQITDGSTRFTDSVLESGNTYTYNIRFYNSGGKGEALRYFQSTKEPVPNGVAQIVSVTPQTHPDADNITVERNSVIGASNYLFDWELNTSRKGTQNPVEISGLPTNENLRIRVLAGNNSGDAEYGDWFNFLTAPSEAPVLTLVNATSSTLLVSLASISGQSNVTYFASVNGGAEFEMQVGDNLIEGLSFASNQLIDVYASNASGDGPVQQFAFTTTNFVAIPEWDEASFVNTIESVTIVWTGSTSSYLIRETSIGSFTEVVGNSYTFYKTPNPNGESFEVELRGKDGGNESDSIFKTVQTNGYSIAETTPPQGSFQI